MSTTRDLVVIIPGILGTQLKRWKGGKARTVWDLRLGTLPATLALLVRERRFAAPSPDDGVVPGDLITEPAWLPDAFGIDGYTKLVELLRDRLGKGQVLTFPYDWRYSNAHSAELFRDEFLPKLERWQKGPGGPGSKLVLVCHSMGGLIARYFCEHLGGAEHTRRIITFGTPHRGSLKALDALIGPPKLGGLFDRSEIVKNWPSVWEMLPQYPCLRRPDKSFVHLQESRLSALDTQQFTDALAFQRAIRDPAERHADALAYEQLVFFGRIQTTPQYAGLIGDAITLLKPGADGIDDRGGDGTVPSFASIPIEWTSTERALPLLDKHAAMATRQSAVEHVLNRLDPDEVSGDKGKGLSADAGDMDGPGVVLDVPDLVMDGDEVIVDVIEKDSAVVRLLITDHQRDRQWREEAELTGQVDERGEILSADLGPLEPGAYTVQTIGTRSVSDHILVWSDAPVPATAASGQQV